MGWNIRRILKNLLTCMRHNVSILLGEDTKQFVARLAKYIYKYSAGEAEKFCHIQSWKKLPDGRVEIKQGELDRSATSGFVSTTLDMYETRLADGTILDAENPDVQLKHYFTKLHQNIVTVNNGGDSNRLLLTLYLPLYDAELCQQVVDIVNALNGIQSHYSVMVVGLCADLRSILHPECDDDKTTPEQEVCFNVAQKESIATLSQLRLASNSLEQVVVLQNINAAGFALNFDEDSFVRIMGELSLLAVEKYDVVFTQAAQFDSAHPLCSIGLSVLNLDRYYFANYLLRRSYLHIMQKEDVGAEKVDLNKVAIVADKHLQVHRNLFTNFYSKNIDPLVRQGMDHDAIVSQTAPQLQRELDEVTIQLTDYINKGDFTLPEKKALLAVILGYDDPLLRGNLFNQDQLTLDNLDEEVANVFIDANNELVDQRTDAEGRKVIVSGPLTVCCGKDGRVALPIKRLQQLRNDMRESTNYIRQKSEELKDIEKMTDDAVESEKRFTEEGFVIEGNVYHFDVEHQEVKFEESYEPRQVTEKSVDLRHDFTPVKDQGNIGACTVFAVASIFEYILKKNSHEIYDLSESFVYYNVRHAEGNERKDTGSSYQDVIQSIGTLGICTEDMHPYSKGLSEEPSQAAFDDGKTRRIVKALNVNVGENDIKSAIQEGYPVAISLKVFNSFSSTTYGGSGSHVGASGFVEYPSDEELASGEFGYHAMVIVGYTDETKHFVVRNSWGKHFGDQGYCYIPYSYICDSDLNRMACIVTEVDTSSIGVDVKTVVGGRGDEHKIVQFNMNDAFIKTYVIKNLLDIEERHLKEMQKEDLKLRHDYETLMQELGRQTKRKEILARIQDSLQKRIRQAKDAQRRINEEDRSRLLKAFDKQTWKKRISLISWNVVFLVLWLIGWAVYASDNSVFQALIDWVQETLSFVLLVCLAIGIISTILYWWWIRSKRRQIEMEMEEKSAAEARTAHLCNERLKVAQLKFHVAGMVVDGLLSLKTSLDQKYQAMKSYIGNLAVWQQEEQNATACMDSLVKNPFIPLLHNDTLNKYFEDNKDDITNNMHLYEYFSGYKLNDEAIIEYKRQLKENFLKHISNILGDFKIFRHVFKTTDYLYLDKEYASAENLLPTLDRKSEPFCQIRSNAVTKPQARFLFINTDSEEKRAWQQVYPQYFNTTPISEDIMSEFKIMALRLQPLAADEILLNAVD